MKKTRYPEQDDRAGDRLGEINQQIKAKVSGFSNRIFSVGRFILGILLLPFVYSSTSAFLTEFGKIDVSFRNYFLYGIIVFFVIHLFIWEPVKIYTQGHKLLEVVFTYIKPLVKTAPYLLPIYAIVLFIIYIPLSYLSDFAKLTHYFMFLSAFSLALHLVFSSKSLRAKKSGFLSGSYIFGFSVVYLLNIFLFCLFLGFIFTDVSSAGFCSRSYTGGKEIISALINQLFINY